MGERTEDLEVKVAYLEKLILDLDEVVRGLADRLDEVSREVHELRDEGLATGDPLQEKPPHY